MFTPLAGPICFLVQLSTKWNSCKTSSQGRHAPNPSSAARLDWDIPLKPLQACRCVLCEFDLFGEAISLISSNISRVRLKQHRPEKESFPHTESDQEITALVDVQPTYYLHQRRFADRINGLSVTMSHATGKFKSCSSCGFTCTTTMPQVLQGDMEKTQQGKNDACLCQ